MNLKDFEKVELLKDLSAVELDPEKKYLIMVNVTSLRYTDGFLDNMKTLSDAFKQAGIKSIILINPMEEGIPQFEIGVEKEIKSEKI